MNKSIFKAVVVGAAFGATAFFAPHVAIGLFLFFGLVRLFCCRRHAMACCGMHHHGHHLYFADHIRSMSEEEYAQFKSKIEAPHHSCCKGKKECCKEENSITN